ncbi:MAG: DUF1343 domain-containing protein [Myxococcota bacterium]
MQTGLERLLAQPRRWLGDRARIGLMANPTAVDHDLRHAADLVHAHPEIDLVRLFGPEHGLRGEAQDMIAVGDARDADTGLPIRSLYGDSFASLSVRHEDVADLDALVFDIQDIGSRYYTYAATMALAMRVCAETRTRLVVLDRPNPIGGTRVEGGGITAGLESFVGLYAIPQRHGLTVGELARLYNDAFGIGCRVDVVPCEGWQRAQWFDDTGLPWVMPSPNMPTLATALVYPGLCLLEGTNVSEGRGTTRPFEIFGAPWVDARTLARALTAYELPGLMIRPLAFEPTFHKHAGRRCGGVQLHVTHRELFLPLRTGIAVLLALRSLWPAQFAWRTERYEFRDDVPAIDLLTGNAAVREALDRGESLDAIMAVATSGTERYDAGRAQALLY